MCFIVHNWMCVLKLMDLCDLFTHIFQDCFTSTGAIIWLTHCWWSPGGEATLKDMGKNHIALCIQHMMPSSNGNLFFVTGPLWGEFTSHEFPSQRPVTQSFDIFFDLHLNKRLSNNRNAGDLRRRRAHYSITVMNNNIRKIVKHVHNSWDVLYSADRNVLP